MKTWKLLCLGMLIFLISGISQAGYVPLRNDVEGDQPRIQVLEQSDDAVQFEVRLPGVEFSEGELEGKTWDRVRIPGGYQGPEIGAPEVPFYAKMIAVPPTSGVRVEFEALDVETFFDVDLMPAQFDEPDIVKDKGEPVRYNAAVYERDAFYPDVDASAGDPGLMRGLRVVPLKMNPVRYNSVTKELRIAHRFRVTVHFEGSDLRNVPVRPMRPISRDLAKVLDDMVVNFDIEDFEIIPLGSYLIICENDNTLINDLQPLIDWKKRKGHKVVLETFSPGASTSTIKNIIQNAYDTWPIPPEYVLLWGDTSNDYALPAYESYGIDHPYTQLDGTDILADVAIGRFPADDQYQTLVMRNKILFYEKMPYTGNDDWYKAGVLVAGSSSSGLSTILANRWIKTRMIERGYTRIDTFWYNMSSGSVVTTLTNGINDGALYVNYRGWLGMQGFDNTDIQNLTNQFMLPFVTILTCGTGGFSGSESRMECFSRVGSPYAPTGSVACVGTATSSTHTKYLNSIDYGMYYCVYDLGVPRPGIALVYGKWELYQGYNQTDPTQLTNFSKWAALAGDPGMELFTQAIQYMDCSVPATVTWGENQLSFTVQETGVGALSDAIVCLYKENELQEVGVTDALGQVTLPLNVNGPGNVKVTITHQNFYPIVDSLDVVQAAVAVGFNSYSVDDDQNGSSSGDGDGVINPGETVEIPLTFKNYGTSTTATGITVIASENDPFVTLNDNSENFPDMAPGATGDSYDDFDLVIAPDCPDGHIIHLDWTASANQGSWDGGMDMTVVSYDMEVHSAYALGSDTLLSPGETADFYLVISNEGGKTASSLSATMTSLSPYVTVNDNSATFGDVTPGSSSTNSSDPFNLAADQDTPPGIAALLEVEYTSSTGAVQIDTITIYLGEKSSTDPQGPDAYGYYCYDNTDLDYVQAPVYDWVEIDPRYGGSGNQLPLNDTYEEDDMSINVQLPFTFTYYGEEFNDITVCTNGWISMVANDALTNFRNWPIPSGIGPNGLVAPFYDDLFVAYNLNGTTGYVYDWYDETNHRFIIEWSRVTTFHTPRYHQTFEIILYDPAYYPTPTGDGEIVFQYQEIHDIQGNTSAYGGDNGYSTVGIESPDKTIGIEVVYWNIYSDPAAAHLESNRAYKFTTALDYSPPTGGVIIDLTYNSGSPVPAGGGNLYFDVYVENVSATPLNFDAWIDIEYEGGAPTTVVLRSFSNYQPGWTINRPNMYFPVPGSYAAGNYMFYGRVGNHPGDVWDEDGFPFTKSGSDFRQGWQPFAPDGVPDPFDQIQTGDQAVLPADYEVLGVYPNPFNPTADIRFALPEAGKVSLKIYDITGRTVATLVDGYREAGVHDVRFDAAGLSSGIYLYRLQVGDFSAAGKMILMK